LKSISPASEFLGTILIAIGIVGAGAVPISETHVFAPDVMGMT
jgi:hypothetical protein